MKNYKRIKSILLSPFTIGVLITIGVTYVAVDYYAKIDEPFTRDDRTVRGLIHQIHEKTIDWRMINRGIAKGSDRVAILAIDDESIRLEGRWPWPRDKLARMIDRTFYNYHAKLMAFDMTFSEPDNSSSLPTLSRLADATKGSPDSKVGTLISSEIAKSDVDAVLATSINGFGDNMILGAFSSDEGVFLPYQDICVEAHFERSYAGRYWSSEIVKSTVIDKKINSLNYPKQAIAANLKDYFSTIETLKASEIFEANPSMNDRITKAFAVGGFTVDPSVYPSITVDNINNDYHAAQDHLADHPELLNNKSIKALFSYLNQALTEKETATFRSVIFSTSLDYCHRFFTDADELRSLDHLHKTYDGSLAPEMVDQLYKTLSWENVWNPKDENEHAPLAATAAAPADGGPPSTTPTPQAPPKPSVGATETSEQGIERIKKEIPPILFSGTTRWEINIPAIDDAKSNTGYFDAIIDNDGTIRRNALLKRDGLSYVESLAFKTFLIDQKLTASAVIDMENVGREESRGRVFKSLEALDKEGNSALKIPIDKKGFLQVNYSGPSYMFPYISATDVLSDGPRMEVTEMSMNPDTGKWQFGHHSVDKAEFLKDKILVLGATAVGVYDLRVTPYEENFPGVETHANALSNLLVEAARARGEKVPADAPGFLRRSPLEETTMWIYLLVGGILLSALLTYFGSVAGLGFTVLFLSAIYYVDNYVLFKSGIVVTSLFPVCLVIFDFVGLTSFKYFTEERKKRELKGTFEKYVSPSIVNELLADPENIELGGKKMELTVMFSDVRGFTTISEKLDPRALSDLLNSYLTPMTNLVFANKGTLDKYMGDAIMAFWGAPVHFKDHAKHAARCALQMLVKLKELQAEYRAKGLPEIDIGIGLNTGDMSVGNMGSDTVRSYTVMGDAVNLGSRLEGINKQYGTRIIVSEFTFNEIKDTFVCREVDWVKVKGKAQPVRIFELVAEGKISPEKTSVLSLFAEGFRLYHEQKFREAAERFTNALSFDANDAPSQLYVERCEDYLREPPPSDWDGVFTMTSK
jgi:adenylate cyclase